MTDLNKVNYTRRSNFKILIDEDPELSLFVDSIYYCVESNKKYLTINFNATDAVNIFRWLEEVKQCHIKITTITPKGYPCQDVTDRFYKLVGYKCSLDIKDSSQLVIITDWKG